MAIFDFLRRKQVDNPVQKEERALNFGLGYNTISSYQTSQSMRLSAVYAAVNMISNSVALLPMKVVSEVDGKLIEMDHPLNKVLNLTPNQKHNHFNWMKLLIESTILKGNGYALIVRDEKLNVKSLELLNPDYVQPMIQKDGTVKYLVSGMKKAVDAVNMIHLYLHVDDQFNGISVLKYADMAINAAYDADKHSDNFFKSGAGLMGVLKASAPLTNDQKKQIAESWEKSITQTMGGGVAILPQGLDFQSISISPEDSQLLESRQYSVIEIARFFGVSPVKLFDLSHVSYSTLEQTNLSYLQDTILPYTRLIIDEFDRKLFKPSEIGVLNIEFDYSALLSTDKKTEAEYYKSLLVNGVLSINDVRNKLGMSPIPAEEGGDAHFMQISYGNVKDVAEGNYIKQTAQEKNTKQDNKLNAEE